MKKSTMSQLSAAGEILSEGYASVIQRQATGIVQGEAKPSAKTTIGTLVKTMAVLTENNTVSKEVRDSLIAVGAYVMVQATAEDMQKANEATGE
jgi:hypothetical protein